MLELVLLGVVLGWLSGFFLSGPVFLPVGLDAWEYRRKAVGYPYRPGCGGNDGYVLFFSLLWPIALYRLYRYSKENS